MATKNIVPRATGEGSLGTAEKKWNSVYANNIILQDGETLASKLTTISSTTNAANSAATSAKNTADTLAPKVTKCETDITTLSDGKVDKTNPKDSNNYDIDSIVAKDDNTTDNHYIRYASGLQICWGKTPSVYLVANGLSYTDAILFAESFISLPYITVTASNPNANVSFWDVNKNYFDAYFRSMSSGGMEDIYGNYIAIGKWK